MSVPNVMTDRVPRYQDPCTSVLERRTFSLRAQARVN